MVLNIVSVDSFSRVTNKHTLQTRGSDETMCDSSLVPRKSFRLYLVDIGRPRHARKLESSKNGAIARNHHTKSSLASHWPLSALARFPRSIRLTDDHRLSTMEELILQLVVIVKLMTLSKPVFTMNLAKNCTLNSVTPQRENTVTITYFRS